MKFRIFICTICLAGGALAQSSATARPEKSSVLILSSSPRRTNDLKILVAKKTDIIKGAPYTATLINEVSRLLADGNRVLNRTAMFVARDREGRTCKAGLSEGSPLSAARWKMITDPAAQATYMFVTSRIVSDKPIAARFNNPEGKSEFAIADDLQDRTPDPPGKVKHESLGTQMMQGFWVEGLRETRTIAAGTVGNELSFNIISEIWYSPDLRIVVLKKQNDPRVGETVLRLTDIKSVEPDPSLFQVPAEDRMRFDQLATNPSHSD